MLLRSVTRSAVSPVTRAITDETMAAIRRLSGQEPAESYNDLSAGS